MFGNHKGSYAFSLFYTSNAFAGIILAILIVSALDIIGFKGLFMIVTLFEGIALLIVGLFF